MHHHTMFTPLERRPSLRIGEWDSSVWVVGPSFRQMREGTKDANRHLPLTTARSSLAQGKAASPPPLTTRGAPHPGEASSLRPSDWSGTGHAPGDLKAFVAERATPPS
jgi:hypothetical protein